MVHLKGMNRRPPVGNRKNIVGFNRNMTTQVDMFLLKSYCALGVHYLGFLTDSLYHLVLKL